MGLVVQSISRLCHKAGSPHNFNIQFSIYAKLAHIYVYTSIPCHIHCAAYWIQKARQTSSNSHDIYRFFSPPHILQDDMLQLQVNAPSDGAVSRHVWSEGRFIAACSFIVLKLKFNKNSEPLLQHFGVNFSHIAWAVWYPNKWRIHSSPPLRKMGNTPVCHSRGTNPNLIHLGILLPRSFKVFLLRVLTLLPRLAPMAFWPLGFRLVGNFSPFQVLKQISTQFSVEIHTWYCSLWISTRTLN